MTQSNRGNATYLVTGATGNVGSAVIGRLLDGGNKVRVFTRNREKVAQWGNRIEVAIGDFTKPETFTRAINRTDAVFLMSQSPDQEAFARLVNAAAESERPRIVFLSSLVATQPELQIGKLHKVKEDAIRQSGLPAKFVRPGGFMSNTYQWISSIEADGVVFNALGKARFPAIAPEDIGEVAARVLVDPTLSGEVFELTGGELLSVAEQVEILAKILNRPIRCVDVPVEVAVQNFIRAGIPAPLAAAVGESFQAIRDGRVFGMTDTVERLTGHRPITFEEWARRHASRFAGTTTAQPAMSGAR